ncbi:uncharacterized protein LOC126895962 isoform X1 [Daktulosphaira vitifoliae]|uniref:uncharacterized protein LOC126895962 isoform X1 n=2 Tax=Daktulosphaira vitifoliae TaxID=58002 RepID=UPI0021AAD5F0|nr:uncharacterized protein LOC126895962 isoform X1 [Daktulosphaira vitifoliae]
MYKCLIFNQPIMIILPVFGLILTAAVQRIHGQCEFPSQWSGRWFQSGVNHHIQINTTSIQTKGHCVQNIGDKFLIEDRNEEDCRRCLVITEKHQNVIQYKENALCEKRSLEELCGEITSDAPLYSMFRVDATPISCPFDNLQAPFQFSYSRGGYTECKSPMSRADSCTSDSRLMLKFQACPDVLNTESTVEELLCLATWKDGSTKYMIGKLEHTPTSTDEEKYRCFVVGKSTGNSFEMAQSGDATCNGMSSPTDGSRTMKFHRVENNHHHHGSGSGCRYPSWLTEHHTWHSLNHGHVYHFSPRNGTLRKSVPGAGPDHDIRATCHRVLNVTDNKALIVTHYTIGCQSGYACMWFHRRDSQVVEVQESENPVENADDACRPENFHSQLLTYNTLVPPSPKGRECPFSGRYEISGGLNGDDVGKALAASRPGSENGQDKPMPCNPPGKQYLTVGCNSADTMEFQSECGTKTVAAYTCYGHWKNEASGINYVISTQQGRTASNSRRYCFIMSQVNGAQKKTLNILSVVESCHPHTIGRLHWAFNITHQGLCDSESNVATVLRTSSTSLVMVVVSLLAIIINR